MRFTALATASSLALAACAGAAIGQEEGAAPPITEFPRDQTLILQNPEPPATNPPNFNIWVAGNGAGWSTGLHQLVMDTLWFIDPDEGLDGPLYNQLAAETWQYNDDFTEMTVDLREGIYWSDGEEFTAEDVVFTVETQMETPGMTWSAAFSDVVETVEAVDDYTVRFTLQEPNSRFHALFSVRWNGAWIMPEHVFSEVEDVMAFQFNPPVGLGPYTLHSFDPNGYWYAWEKREDWDRTALAEWGEPGPQYVIYRSIPTPDNRLIEMANGNLDVIHDLTPEATFSIIEDRETARGWFPGFPYAHPDPTLPMVIFNTQRAPFDDRRVRWALALMLDARAISMASYRGAATLSAIAMPPTGTHPDDYHAPMQDWLIDYELDLGNGETIQPYDPSIGSQIAEMVRPQFGEDVPTEEAAIQRAFGFGWWRQDLEAAATLLEAAGFTEGRGGWMTPEGEPFEFEVNTFTDGVINRMGTMIAQQWTQAGIEVTPVADPQIFASTLPLGDYDVATAWSIETWGGDPDLSYFLDSWHSDFVVEPGERQPARNWQRWSSPALDGIIEEVRTTEFTDPRNLELGRDFVRLMVDEMPVIPMMAYNVFSVYDTEYWEGFPTAEERPYANIVNNWANSKYIFTQLRPAGQTEGD
ncbi:ABC transporter substrate-binding protein [Pseudoroseicyclus aestuarii]|uniref:Peptide/nickel transport system substrate-binding protein n=1 Tax=Pseudoroseicyclus aestuarii TaxID=1795041 RepID=A0A318SQ33_9RHOB|nr:ABC transporter substrate-binding protein [Pseudoroseicyclus aestuarii]PYE82458.1 peptide/nickel transport system substrate-binding protein [Pseudoroseicyclus aestuarii]